MDDSDGDLKAVLNLQALVRLQSVLHGFHDVVDRQPIEGSQGYDDIAELGDVNDDVGQIHVFVGHGFDPRNDFPEHVV